MPIDLAPHIDFSHFSNRMTFSSQVISDVTRFDPDL